MKKIIQNLKNGQTSIIDVPTPSIQDGFLLIKTKNSVISPGTEKMLVDFGKANYLNKARQQPDKVKSVIDKAKTDGIFSTIDAVKSKLDQPIALGYCNAGVVVESTVSNFSKGDRVISNGSHAEIVLVPKNLCAKVPDNVDDEAAAYTVLGAIGLQGIRLIKPSLGESIVVFGLGVIGLLTVQMLRANGCRVLGVDLNTSRCNIAREFGAETVDLSINEDPIKAAKSFSNGIGVDGVIIAAASQSDELIHQAAEVCRKRGRIVLVGVAGLKLRREDFFNKELTFQVSSSYGPGRYDPLYEDRGNDYPVGYVRWTEQRNFEAVLQMMSDGKLNIKPLITKRYRIEDAGIAYDSLSESSTLSVLLEYSEKEDFKLTDSTVTLDNKYSNKSESTSPVVGFVGAGNYASRILIPAFKLAGASLNTIATSNGISGVHHGKKSGFKTAITDLDLLWKNEEINTVAIATRHNSHVSQVISALRASKHVFVEKPLAINLNDLDKINNTYNEVNKNTTNDLKLMVGFNRRFAPHIVKMKELLVRQKEPKTIVITVNSGYIPAEHWTQDIEIGGGRIIGEACHFVDLISFLINSPIDNHYSMMIGSSSSQKIRDDKATINLSFEDGSIGTIHYFANGGKSFPKERIEVFCDNAILQMDNYRVLKGFDWPGFKNLRLFKQNKGQNECAKAFIDSIRNGQPSPIPFNEIIATSRISIEIASALRQSK